MASVDHCLGSTPGSSVKRDQEEALVSYLLMLHEGWDEAGHMGQFKGQEHKFSFHRTKQIQYSRQYETLKKM